MANEAARINNPDSVPGLVSTGYQLQNTNIVASRVGMDATVVTGGTGQCVLEISGPVDVNGVLYSIGSAVTFTLTVAGTYYIHLAGSGNNLTPTIGTGANTFDPDKNARYTDTGSYRVLNWVVYFDGVTAEAVRLLTPENGENESRFNDVYIETLTLGVLNMYAVGNIEIFSWVAVGDSYSNIATIKKPCTVYVYSGSTLSSMTTLKPGFYALYCSTAPSPDLITLRKLYSDSSTASYNSVPADSDGVTAISISVNAGNTIKIQCIYAEGMSVLDVDKIIE